MLQFLRSPWSRRPKRPDARSSFRPQVEGLETRALPSISLPSPGGFGPATVMGTSSNDQFVLRLMAGNNNYLQISDNGGTSFSTVSVFSLSAVNVSGFNGNDTLTIDNSNGVVGKAGDLSITFDGGAGVDTVVLSGNPNTMVGEYYAIGATTDAGTVAANSATGGSFTLGFKNTSAITDTLNALVYSVILNDNANYVTVNRGTAVGTLTTLELAGVDTQNNTLLADAVFNTATAAHQQTAAGLSFVPVTFANKTNVGLHAGGGDDTILLNDSTAVTGLAALVVDGGDGTDRTFGNATPQGSLYLSTQLEQTTGAATDAIFIQQLYALRYNRLAADSEVAIWAGLLHNGGGTNRVVRGIEEFPATRSRLVTEWFAAYLNRAPDTQTLANLVNWLQAGATEEQGLATLLGSTEYITNSAKLFSSGTADQRFVTALFQQVLGRSPTATELSNYLAMHPTQNGVATAYTLLTGTAARTRFVTALYDTYLNHDPDAATLKAYVNGSLNFTQLREAVLSSLEFFDPQKAAATHLAWPTTLTASLPGVLQSSFEQQFYWFTVGKQWFININVQQGTAGTIAVQLEDAVGNVLATTSPTTNVNKLRALVQPGQTYYLRIMSVVNTPANFTLQVSLVQ
jgi:hypothetical protein